MEDGLHVLKMPSFATKNAGTIDIGLEDRLGSRLALHFGGFFNQIKRRQKLEREDSIQAVFRRMRRLEGFLYQVAKNFDLL